MRTALAQLLPTHWVLAALAIAAYSELAARIILSAMRLLEPIEMPRAPYFFDNQGILLKGVNILIYSPLLESLQLGIVYILLKKAGIRSSLCILGSALPLVLLHVSPRPRDAVVTLPFFLISAIAFDRRMQDGWLRAVGVIALAHAIYNITPFLNTLSPVL